MRFVLVLLSAFAFAAATAFAATTIDTTVPADWNGSQGVGTFGFPNTATYGQVITVSGNDSLLHDFTLFVNLPPTAVFRAAVYSWNASASRATGPSLYESAPRSTTTTGMLAEKFTPAAPLALTPNAQYVLLLSVSK